MTVLNKILFSATKNHNETAEVEVNGMFTALVEYEYIPFEKPTYEEPGQAESIEIKAVIVDIDGEESDLSWIMSDEALQELEQKVMKERN